MAKTKLEGVFGKRQALGYFTCKGVSKMMFLYKKINILLDLRSNDVITRIW
jgi:hypothetical protein